MLKCDSVNNQECKARPKGISISSNELYPYSILVNKCSGSCNNINDPFAKLCVPDVVEGINIKVFNLMSRTSETGYIGWHKTCSCKCRLDASACNNKQSWNNDKCRCECEELIDKCSCDEGFIRIPTNCDCECDKSSDVGEHLDDKNCKCRSKCIIVNVLFLIFLIISLSISSGFIYFHCYSKKRYIEQQFIKHINGKY